MSDHQRFAFAVGVAFIAALLITLAVAIFRPARADDIVVAKCYEPPCRTAQPTVRGPGRLAYCWQTAPDACAVPLIYMLKVPAGEYLTMDVDPVWLRKWLDLYGLDCARYKYRWIHKPPPGASKAWSEFGQWCHGLEER